MASITFSFPDESAPLIAAAFCNTYGYQTQVPDPANPGQLIPNPQSPDEFARQKVADYVRDVCRAYIAQQKLAEAQTQARQLAQQQVDAIPVTITAT